jgi:hypothetical protein
MRSNHFKKARQKEKQCGQARLRRERHMVATPISIVGILRRYFS